MNASATNSVSSDELRLASRSLSEGLMQTELFVPEIHCGGCISRIESALSKLDGVSKVRVNLTEKRVSVQWLSTECPQKILHTLVNLGFNPEMSATQTRKNDKLMSAYLRALAVSGFAAGNVMLLSVAVWSGADEGTRQIFHMLSAAITIPAIVFSGQVFFRSAWHALKSRTTNMDVPISIGIVLSCLLSLYDTVMHNEQVYYEAAIMLVFFLLIGRTLDHMMRSKASNVVSALQALEPAGAQRVNQQGLTEFTPTGALVPGDHIVVAAASRIPADSIVVSGESDINSEIVNGESLPCLVSMGQPVLAGTMNLTKPLTLMITASAADSFLASMQQLVRFGQGKKGPYRLLADRVSKLYAPFVHTASLLAFFYWYFFAGDLHQAITIAVSVLIITCPCALALAVPMVQTIAAQRLLRSGVVMKNGAALEKMQLVNTVVFDKTGTITDGLPELHNRSSYSEQSIALVRLIAANSEHPYAKAIVNMANGPCSKQQSDSNLAPTEVSEVPGCGIQARFENRTLRFGKRSWAVGNSSALPETKSELSEAVLTEDGHIIAEFYFKSHLRADAKMAINLLQNKFPEVILLSGDTSDEVNAINQLLHFDSASSGCLPADKLKKILRYEKEGQHVLMVGDGLNDAAAMAGATVSMAPGNAASVSRSLADFVFLRKSLLAIPHTVSVAIEAHRLIKQNFTIALGYNLVALPIAFAGYVTPLVAALAMSISSILVVANAMRIRHPASIQTSKKSQSAIGVAA